MRLGHAVVGGPPRPDADAPPPEPTFQTESVATAQYFIHRLATPATEGLITFDIGGQTTDVAVVQSRSLEAERLVWRGSFQLAGRHLLIEHLRENRPLLEQLAAQQRDLADLLPNRSERGKASPDATIEQDGWAQRAGIDRLLTLACGRTFTVDEKIRTADWPDVLLEQWSDQARRVPGWVQKPLACDFIAYAFAPTGTCILMPVPALHRAWRQHGRQWIRLYGTRLAQNPGYTSICVPVPRGVLMQALVEAMFVT